MVLGTELPSRHCRNSTKLAAESFANGHLSPCCPCALHCPCAVPAPRASGTGEWSQLMISLAETRAVK